MRSLSFLAECATTKFWQKQPMWPKIELPQGAHSTRSTSVCTCETCFFFGVGGLLCCFFHSEFFLRGGEGGFHPLSRFFFEFLGGVSKNFGWFLGFLSFLGGGENACELGDSRSKLEGGRVFQRLSHYKLQVFLAFDGRNS